MVVMSGHLVIQAWIVISLNLTLQRLRVKRPCHHSFHLDHLLQALNLNPLEPEDKELCHRVLLPRQPLQQLIRYGEFYFEWNIAYSTR